MEKYVRKLQRTGTHSYIINIPKRLVKKLNWKEKQKLVLTFGGRKPEINIKDWE